MKKKFVTCLLCLISVFVMGVLLGACGETAHTHTFEWVEKTPATCTEEGVEEQECTECHEKGETRKTQKLSHTSDEVWHVDAEKGTHYHECTVCKTHIDEAEHGEETLPAVDATCTSKGKTAGKKCPVCDTVLQEQTETEMIAHTSDEIWHVDAEKGTHYHECTVCKTHMDEGAHSAAEGWLVDAESGTHYHECSACQTKMDETAHTPDNVWHIDAAGGKHYHECTACQAHLDETAHAMTVWENSQTDGTWYHTQKCADCGYATQAEACSAGSSAWQREEVSDGGAHYVHFHVCTQCGNKNLDRGDCDEFTYQPLAGNTTDHMKLCGTCKLGAKEAHAASETLGRDENEHWTVCELCQAQMSDKTAHTRGYKMDKATTGHFLVCTDCGEYLSDGTHSAMEVIPHRGDAQTVYTFNGSDGHTFVCVDCKEEVLGYHSGPITSNEWEVDPEDDSKCFTRCKYCQEALPFTSMPHTASSYAFKPSADDPSAGHYKYCARCKTPVGDLLEHALVYYKYNEEHPGYHTRSCSCGYVGEDQPCYGAATSYDVKENVYKNDRVTFRSLDRHVFTCFLCHGQVDGPHIYEEKYYTNDSGFLVKGELVCGCGLQCFSLMPNGVESPGAPREEVEFYRCYFEIRPKIKAGETGTVTLPSVFDGKPVTQLASILQPWYLENGTWHRNERGEFAAVSKMVIPESYTRISATFGNADYVTDEDRRPLTNLTNDWGFLNLKTLVIKGNIKWFGYSDTYENVGTLGSLDLDTIVLPSTFCFSDNIFPGTAKTIYFMGDKATFEKNFANAKLENYTNVKYFGTDWKWAEDDDTTPVEVGGVSAMPAILPGKEW